MKEMIVETYLGRIKGSGLRIRTIVRLDEKNGRQLSYFDEFCSSSIPFLKCLILEPRLFAKSGIRFAPNMSTIINRIIKISVIPKFIFFLPCIY